MGRMFTIVTLCVEQGVRVKDRKSKDRVGNGYIGQIVVIALHLHLTPKVVSAGQYNLLAGVCVEGRD